MTDRQGALGVLANSDGAGAGGARSPPSTTRYKDDALVLDKWFTAQALSTRDDTLERGRSAARTIPISRLANPNRLRSLVGAFAREPARLPRQRRARAIASSPTSILAVDKLNPQTAAKLVPPLGRWRRFGEERAALMRAALERIVATPGLSKDVFEQASKSLAWTLPIGDGAGDSQPHPVRAPRVRRPGWPPG